MWYKLHTSDLNAVAYLKELLYPAPAGQAWLNICVNSIKAL